VAANPSGSPGWPYSFAQEAAVTAREDDRCGAETLGDGLAAAPRHLTFRLRAGADDDPCRDGRSASKSGS